MDYAPKRAKHLVGKAPRVDKYEGHECTVDECSRTCRAMSRYCHTHASRFFRTRNPNGRMPRRKELIPYRDLALHALDRYALATHPAILAAERKLENMVSRPGAIPERYAKHWRRLSEGGATGRDMLLTILSVYGLRYVGVRDVFTDDAVFFCCLGSRFLRTVPVGWRTTCNGNVEQVRLPGLDAEVVGRALADKIGALAILFWRRVEAEEAKRTAEAMSIREALERHPL